MSLAIDLALRAPGLAPVADYFPLERGRYEVQAGLKILGQQPVQGVVEHHHFTMDELLPQYLRNKQLNMAAAPERYHPRSKLPPDLEREIGEWWFRQMVRDFPDRLQGSYGPGGALRLHDRWTDWHFELDVGGAMEDGQGGLRPAQGFEGLGPPVFREDMRHRSLDAFARMIAEDVAIVQRDPWSGRDGLVWIHLNSPNHWSAADKLGKDFLAVHEPVADFGAVAKAADRIIDAMINKGPFIRFAWGVATDTVLDHHPDSPAGRDLADKTPAGALEGTFLRIERQTLKGFPRHGAALFTIRTYFKPIAEIAADPERRELLREAISSISPEALRYKGLAPYRDLLLQALS
ncbi:MAG: heme-dependent oxidative N-demethylase subunit alpha family protein [Candidatus Sericytochromatia bacterium]|nr:heme-dependent oxidative N-demethylase subunit alpha family protein [Candidatus Sericytochromatia bacterium]